MREPKNLYLYRSVRFTAADLNSMRPEASECVVWVSQCSSLLLSSNVYVCVVFCKVVSAVESLGDGMKGYVSNRN